MSVLPPSNCLHLRFKPLCLSTVRVINICMYVSYKKHLKNVGPIRYCEPPLHCQSPGVASRTPAIAIAQAACDVNNNDSVLQGTAMAPWNGPNKCIYSAPLQLEHSCITRVQLDMH